MLFYIPAAILVYCCDQTALTTSFFYMLCDHEIKNTMYLGKKDCVLEDYILAY